MQLKVYLIRVNNKMVEKKEKRLIPSEIEEDKKINLRPNKIEEFIGQDSIKLNLQTFIKSSIKRKKNLDHIILYGPPGFGKTTLANIISHEKNVNIHVTSEIGRASCRERV